MKLLTNLLGMGLAGTLGYLAEPELRFNLTGVPAKVVVKSDVIVADATSGVKMTISAGSKVNLVRIDGANAIVSPGGINVIGSIPIGETDLVTQIAARPAAADTLPSAAAPSLAGGGDSQEPAATPEPPPTPEPAPTPAPVATPEPAPTPAPVAAPEPEAAPPSAPEPLPAPEPIPAPEPMPELGARPAPAAGPVDVVEVMKQSIQAAQIKEFTSDQVLDWKPEADEIVDGESYQTGLASYKAETIFGVKTIQAKALIKGGKVHRWIWPKSGMDIK
jgi:hypothetical protein